MKNTKRVTTKRLVIDERKPTDILGVLNIFLAAISIVIGMYIFINISKIIAIVLWLFVSIVGIFKITYPLYKLESVPTYEINILIKKFRLYTIIPTILELVVIILTLGDLIRGTSFLLHNWYTSYAIWVLMFSEVVRYLIDLIIKNMEDINNAH